MKPPDHKPRLPILGDVLLALLALIVVVVVGYPILQAMLAFFASD